MASRPQYISIPSFTGALVNTIAAQYQTLPASQAELEARFDYYLDDPRGLNRRDSRVISGIPLTQYTRVLKELPQYDINPPSRPGVNYVRTLPPIHEDLYSDFTRITDGQVTQKNLLYKWTNEPRGISINLSREIPIRNTQGQKTGTRDKIRTEIDLLNYYARADLTRVEEQFSGRPSNVKYEIEVEFIPLLGEGAPSLQEQVKKYIQGINIVYKILYDTELLYTREEICELQKSINDIIPFKNSCRYTVPGTPEPRDLINKARDLTPKDMVFGGLLGNDITSYQVTFKTDGLRKLLYVGPLGVWLFMPTTNQYSKVSPANPIIKDVYVMDGEYVTELYNKNGEEYPEQPRYYVFDCLIYESRDVANELGTNHNKRLNYATNFKREMETLFPAESWLQKLIIKIKGFYSVGSPDEFYQTMQTMETLRITLPYREDGLIFTPYNTVYNPNPEEKTSSSLVEQPDVVKWKPVEFLTIDFNIQWDSDKLHLWSSDRYGPHQIGTFKYSDFPFRQNVILEDPKGRGEKVVLSKRKTPSGTIVEFGWDNELNAFYPYRVRDDKLYPNRLSTAINIWKLIERPITWDILTGNSLQQMYNYHNRIKSELFSQHRGYLIDIGAGRGGDLGKWEGYTKIIAVEPDDKNRAVLIERLEKNRKIRDKVFVVKAGGEDTDIIEKARRDFFGPDQKADVVAMMLSMSFFWDSQKHVKELIRTIETVLKPNGTFIYLTIDGDSVEQLYYPAFRETVIENPIVLRGYNNPTNILASLSFDGENTLDVVLPNTIVGEQREYLVRLMDIVSLSGYRFKMNEAQRATKEPFLPPAALLLTRLYTYGSFDRTVPDSGSEITPLKKYPTLEELPMVAITAVPKGVVGPTSVPREPLLKGQQQLPMEPPELPVVRYASPMDYSFVHSVLLAISEEYRQLNSEEKKQEYRLKFFEGWVEQMKAFPVEEEPLKSMWKEAIRRLESGYLGFSEIQLLSTLLQIQFVIYQSKTDKLEYRTRTNIEEGEIYPVIHLNRLEDDHYELLGRLTSQGPKVIFELPWNQ